MSDEEKISVITSEHRIIEWWKISSWYWKAMTITLSGGAIMFVVSSFYSDHGNPADGKRMDKIESVATRTNDNVNALSIDVAVIRAVQSENNKTDKDFRDGIKSDMEAIKGMVSGVKKGVDRTNNCLK